MPTSKKSGGAGKGQKPPAAFRPLDDVEAEKILTGIARAGQNDAARIAAIRALRLMREEAGAGASPPGGRRAPERGEEPLTFEQLDELAMRRAGNRGR